MPAAYYDIITDEGSSFRLKIKFMDKNKKSVNLLNPPVETIEGFEDRFPKDSNNNILPFKAYVRMQVRDSVDGDIIPIEGDSDLIGNLSGQSDLSYSNIQIQTKDGGINNNEANIILTIQSNIMSSVNYGNFLYDIEVIFSQDIINHPNAVVYRILQGRFVVTPNITR